MLYEKKPSLNLYQIQWIMNYYEKHAASFQNIFSFWNVIILGLTLISSFTEKQVLFSLSLGHQISFATVFILRHSKECILTFSF